MKQNKRYKAIRRLLCIFLSLLMVLPYPVSAALAGGQDVEISVDSPENSPEEKTRAAEGQTDETQTDSEIRGENSSQAAGGSQEEEISGSQNNEGEKRIPSENDSGQNAEGSQKKPSEETIPQEPSKARDVSGDSKSSGEEEKAAPSVQAEGRSQEENVTQEAASGETQQSPALYKVTLDLNGGLINGLIPEGWKKLAGTYSFEKTVPENTVVTLQAPYRAGYTFAGWEVKTGQQTSVSEDMSFPVSADMTLRAAWTDTVLTVSFKGYQAARMETLWTVQVPYASALWVREDTLWTDASLHWTAVGTGQGSGTETAEVSVWAEPGEASSAETVTVTRHQQEGWNQAGHEQYGYAQYYYTFQLNGVSYFTYGGKSLERDGYYFHKWKMTKGDSGEDDRLRTDAEFTAQYTSEENYVFNMYYYYDNGTRVPDSVVPVMNITKRQRDVESMQATDKKGKTQDWQALKIEVRVPKIRLYEADKPQLTKNELRQETEELTFSGGISATLLADGVALYDTERTEGETKIYTIVINVPVAFRESTVATRQMTFFTTYSSADINYQIEYYQQKVGNGTNQATDYVKVGFLKGQVKVGNRLAVPDDPPQLYQNESSDAPANTDFDGFIVSDESMDKVYSGVTIGEEYINEDGTMATVKIYYDRVQYHIYIMSDSSETTYDPRSVQYGASLNMAAVANPTKTGYIFNQWKWQQTDAQGILQDITKPEKMPAADLYYVATWNPGTAHVQVVYWLEEANSSDYQNSFTEDAFTTTTNASITVDLKKQEITYGDGQTYLFSKGMEDCMKEKYDTTDRYCVVPYEQFFSYYEPETRKDQINVENARQTDPDKVAADQIAGDTYAVQVRADSSTTINVYYRRKMYSLFFVTGRYRNNQTAIASATGGSVLLSGWAYANPAAMQIKFSDFSADVMKTEDIQTNYTILHQGQSRTFKATKKYTLLSAQNDARAPVGRYGMAPLWDSQPGKGTGWQGDGYVYILTAKFEADITEFWPTMDNIGKTGTTNVNYRYISQGTSIKSLYWREKEDAAKGSNKNILNRYQTMDKEMICRNDGTGEDKWVAQEDTAGWMTQEDVGDGTIANEFFAYWAQSNIRTYHYYFLYESLDTTLKAADFPEFNAATATNGGYADKTVVRYKNGCYVFRDSYMEQNSTHNIYNQNQPARVGYDSMGYKYRSVGSAGNAGNNYYFYKRKEFHLILHNVNDVYKLPDDALSRKMTLTYYDEDVGADVEKENISLHQLGWVRRDEIGMVLKYGAPMNALNSKEMMAYLLSGTAQTDRLEYPLYVMGDKYHYFHRWYKNSAATIRADWTSRDMQMMTKDYALYAGWYMPRYVTTYQLNGGSWTEGDNDKIEDTFLETTIDGHIILLVYPHLYDGTDPDAKLYWYEVTELSDPMYAASMYQAKDINFFLEKNEDNIHYHLKAGMSLETMVENSIEDEAFAMMDALTGKYSCRMSVRTDDNGHYLSDTSQSHQFFVHINQKAGTALERPNDPVRNGYTFYNWYIFDEMTEEQMASAPKTYLEYVLDKGSSIKAYKAGYVYVTSRDDAYLLRDDGDGKLYYYPQQKGYKYTFDHEAARVNRDRTVYASWKAASGNSAEFWHLIKAGDLTEDLKQELDSKNTKKVMINYVTYYRLQKTERLTSLYTGSVQTGNAVRLSIGNKWLPDRAQLRLGIGEETVTGSYDETYGSYLHTGEEHSFRMQDPDTGQWIYYGYILYTPKNQISYRVYTINLGSAVSSGVFSNYYDSFDRGNPPDPHEAYVFDMREGTYEFTAESTGELVLNAPHVSGFQVYSAWTQTVQLEAYDSRNNFYFYYINSEAGIDYDITFYFMHEGSYSDDNSVKITNIPAQEAQIVNIEDVKGIYTQIVSTMEEIHSYKDAPEGSEEANYYNRYKKMTATASVDGYTGTYEIENGGALDTAGAAGVIKDYVADSWSPDDGDVVLADDTHIDVYFKDASIRLRKENSDGDALRDAQFRLECFRPLAVNESISDTDEIINYEAVQYKKVKNFGTDGSRTVTSNGNGSAIFYDLSADDTAGYLYRLTETKAPAGQIPLAEPVFIRVPLEQDDNGTKKLYYSVTYTIVNPGISYLPKAGGSGVYIPLLFGGAFLSLAFVGMAAMMQGAEEKRKKCSCEGRRQLQKSGKRRDEQ